MRAAKDAGEIRRPEIRPGAEFVPSLRDGTAILCGKFPDAAFAEYLVQHLTMDVVYREIGIDRPKHSPERAAPVLIGESMPIPLGMPVLAGRDHNGAD